MSAPPQNKVLIGERLLDMVRDKLAGRKIDIVIVVNQLLLLAEEAGEIYCTPIADSGLHFDLRDQEPCEIELDIAHSKLRAVCARLAKLREESGEAFEPYGGEGVITREAVEMSYSRYADWLKEQRRTAPDSGNGSDSLGETDLPPLPAFSRERWKVSYKNTTGQQKFTIIAD